MNVNILGTKYTISCNSVTKEILIGDASEEEFFDKLSPEEQKIITKEIMRHEIVHAFMNESGLQDSSLQYCDGWAKNEEMIDWIALQGLKLYEAWQSVDAI